MAVDQQGPLLSCDARIFPSWASGWIRCGSIIGNDGRCAKYGHQSDLDREQRQQAKAEILGKKMLEIWLSGKPIEPGGKIDWTRFARELLDQRLL